MVDTKVRKRAFWGSEEDGKKTNKGVVDYNYLIIKGVLMSMEMTMNYNCY